MNRLVTKLSYLYVLASVILGPLILYVGHKLFPQRLACFDIEQNLPHQDIILNVQREFIFDSACAIIMISIGISLLAYMRTHKKDTNKNHRLALNSLIFLMLLGYTFIILYIGLLLACVAS